jgi:hypothetical protein
MNDQKTTHGSDDLIPAPIRDVGAVATSWEIIALPFEFSAGDHSLS